MKIINDKDQGFPKACYHSFSFKNELPNVVLYAVYLNEYFFPFAISLISPHFFLFFTLDFCTPDAQVVVDKTSGTPFIPGVF